MKVSVEETLLKKYSDKELVKYVSDSLDVALASTVTEEVSTEAKLAIRLAKIGQLAGVLRAVSKRMNGGSQDPKVML